MLLSVDKYVNSKNISVQTICSTAFCNPALSPVCLHSCVFQFLIAYLYKFYPQFCYASTFHSTSVFIDAILRLFTENYVEVPFAWLCSIYWDVVERNMTLTPWIEFLMTQPLRTLSSLNSKLPSSFSSSSMSLRSQF